MANPFKKVVHYVKEGISHPANPAQAVRKVGALWSPKTGLTNPHVLKWLFTGGKSPLAPKSPVEDIQSSYKAGQITTPEQSRSAIDRLIGFDPGDQSQSTAIKHLRDQGGLSRVVKLVFPESAGSLATPFSAEGQAKFATGDFREFRDPYTILDQHLSDFMSQNPGVGGAYMRDTDPMSLLPVLIEQDRSKVGAEKDSGIRDIGGRLMGALKATLVTPWSSASRLEEVMGYAQYNNVPDTNLRWQMSSHYYELQANQLMGHNALSRTTEKANQLLSIDLPPEERAKQFNAWFQKEGNLGMAGMLANLTGQIIFDPLWLLPIGAIGNVATKPIKAYTGTERLAKLLRVATPAGREAYGSEKGIRAGLRAVTAMPEMVYSERKWALLGKGVTGPLFDKTPESIASSAQGFVGLPATAAMRQFDSPDVLASFLEDLNTTAKTGVYTGLVKQRMPGLLERPESTDFFVMTKGLDQDLVDPEIINAVRDGMERFAVPLDERVTLASEYLHNRIQVLGSREVQKQWRAAGAAGRIVTDKLIPFNRATQAVLATTSINTPGFMWLNFVSNTFHVMWNFLGDPITGSQAIAHSLWTESSAALPEGGRYTAWMANRLAASGLIPHDIERFITRQSGSKELFDIGNMTEETVTKQLGEDTLENAQAAQDLIEKAVNQPVKHIGNVRRKRDILAPFVYGASRIDHSYRRAAFSGSLKQQAHIGTAASRVSAERLIPTIERDLINAGIDPEQAAHMEGATRDWLFGTLQGRRSTLSGGAVTDADITKHFEDLIAQLGDKETLGGFRSGIAYAEDFVKMTKGVVGGEAQVIHTHDLRDIAEYLSNDILPKLGRDLTPNQAARMLRQKVEGYFDAADIGRELGRMESTVRPATTYSSNLRLTDKALRHEMTDTVDTLERFLRAQFFGDEGWLRIPKSSISPARRFHQAARNATVRNVEGLQGIKNVYDHFANLGIGEIAGDTPIPKELVDQLPDWLRASAANIPILGAEEIATGVHSFKVGGVEIAVSSTKAHPEIMVDIERVSGRASVKELRDVEDVIARVVQANPGRPVNAVVRRDLADILIKRGAKEIAPGGNDVGTVLDLTPLGKKAGQAVEKAPVAATPVRQLPQSLRGAKPRYNIGSKSFEPQFESDIDKALFIVAQTKPSKSDAKYLEFLRGHFPELKDNQIRDFGRAVRNEIKGIAQVGEEGVIHVPDLSGTRSLERQIVAGEAKAALPVPQTPKPVPSSLKLSDVWDNYFTQRDGSWKGFFEEARGIAEGNAPAQKAISALEEHLQKTFEYHRDIISKVPSRASELGNLDAAWKEAASKIQRRFSQNAKKRPGLLGLTPNDSARQAHILDPQGPLAQEVSDFVEHVIPQLRKDVAELKAGKITLGTSPKGVLLKAADDMKGRIAEGRQVMIANARAATDHAMLNYGNQYGIDHVMKILFPFSFWPTRQAAHWGIRAARNPGAFASLVTAMTQPAEYYKQYGYPQRLNVKIPIYMPWLGEFLDKMPVVGSRLQSADFAPYYFVDPMRMLFPYKQLVTDQFDDPAKRNTPSGMVLDWFEKNTTMGISPFMKIIGGQVGLLDADAWRSFGFQGGPFGIPITPTARAVGKWFYEGDPNSVPTAEQAFYCVDEKTEILTHRGWLKYSEVFVGDQAVGLREAPNGNRFFQWEPIQEVNIFPVEDQEMISMDSERISMLLTPNHRCLFQNMNTAHVKAASELKIGDRIPVSYQFPNRKTAGVTTSVASLLGWYLTEGHDRKDGRIIITQSAKVNSEFCAEIVHCLDSIRGMKWRENKPHPNGCRIFSIERVGAHILHRWAPNKQPRWDILQLWGRTQLRALWEAMLKGDGTWRGDTLAFTQFDQHRRDFFQALCLRLGIWASPNGKHEIHCHRWNGRTRGPTFRKVTDHLKRVQYTGDVWCPKMESGFWLARRNGKPFVTGNSERGYFSKGLLGDILGLSPSKFDVYRAERALWSLAATGELLPGKTKDEQVEAAWLALDLHSGSAWKNAVKSAESETFLSRFTGYVGFPAGPVTGLNQGEYIWLGLKAAEGEYAKRGQLDKFYEKYPEFEIRSAVIKGISDPKEKEKAVDTELYYQSIDKLIDKPYAPTVDKLSDALQELHQQEQTVDVREQEDIITTQLKVIDAEKSTIRDTLDTAFPNREKTPSLNRDPRERALAGLRDQWYEIKWNKAGGEPYEVYQARQQAFISDLPQGEDPTVQEDVWHGLTKESILAKVSASLAIDQAIKDEDYNKVDQLTSARDSQLESIHADATQVVTQRDFLRYMASYSNPKTPEEQLFDSANDIYDLWKSLTSSDSPFTSREKTSINAYFRSLPEIQKYFPFDAITNWSRQPIEVRQAIMTRREFWRSYHAISDPKTKLDWFYLKKDELNQANAILGIPTPSPIEATFIPPEYSSDPLYAHVELMAALQQGQALNTSTDFSPSDQRDFSQLLSTYGSEDDTFGGLSADEANSFIDLVAPQ